MRFDRIIAVDWSARSKPSPKRPCADAIWLAVWEDGSVADPEYFRIRSAAMARISKLLQGPGRVLLGFDFAFGYPPGFAAALTGAAEALAVWDWLAARIMDDATNANNRWEVAAQINRAFPGTGPLWGCPANVTLDGLPARGSLRQGHGVPDKRAVDVAGRTASPAVKLYTTGSVGSQSLLGLPHLARLRRDFPDLVVWPQQTGFTRPQARIVLAEIYPSLVTPAPHPIKDAGQVLAMARALGSAPDDWFTAPAAQTEADRIAREEGWILGVGPQGPLAVETERGALPGGVDWTPVDEVLASLSNWSPATTIAEVPIEQAAGRILGADLTARRANPPTANAAVDGWGFAHATLPKGPIPVTPGRAAAGEPHTGRVIAGHAIRILTGAELPEGVDTIALQENAWQKGAHLHLSSVPKSGANTRPAGEDIQAGQTILSAGTILRPSDAACAIAAGLGAAPCYHPLKVAVLSTGSEIIPPGATGAGIFDANRPMLMAMLRGWGMQTVDLGHIPDDPDALRRALTVGAEADAILTSGGASAGDEDHLAHTIRSMGEILHWRVAVKPGRPLLIGRWAGTPLFGLPGNPVAAFTCAALFARPGLLRLAGAANPTPSAFMVPASFMKHKKAGRREYLRARLTPDGAAEIFASEGSGRVSGISWAEGFVELPDSAAEITPGTPIRYIPFSALGIG